MKKMLICFFSSFLFVNTNTSQVTQFPQVYNNDMDDPGASNLNIRQTPSSSGTILINGGFGIGSKIGAASLASNSSDPYFYHWIQVCLPSTTGSLSYGYIACDEFYARINPINNYATVTATSLNIRPTAGSTQWVTIGGQNAMYGQNSIVALTGTTSVVSGTTWYQVYLTRNCSQTTGWLSGAFLTINSTTSNYRTVGGRVCNDASSCNFLGNLNGATINMSGIGVTNSSGGFYQYKLPTNYTTTITCTYPGYNTSTPPSYIHTASSHNYTRHFVLSNSCSPPSTPLNLTVTSVSQTSIGLSWSAVSGSGITYEILKNNTSCSSPFGSSGFTTSSTNITITGLTQNTTYYFVVTANNTCGPSGNSNCVVATTTSATPVANFYSPTPIIVAGQTAQFFNQSTNATSYNWLIEREQWNGSYAFYSSSTQTNPSFSFNISACYRVSLTASSGPSNNTITRPCYIYVTPDLNSPIPADVTRAQKYYTYKAGDPVNLTNGSYTFSMRDLSISAVKSRFSLERRYFSNSSYESVFGIGWHHSFDIKVNFSNSFDWFVQYPDGHNEHFVPYKNGETRSLYPGNYDSLYYTSSGSTLTSFTLQKKDGIKWYFDGNGLITSIVDLNGNAAAFNYTSGKLEEVILPGGRQLQFLYNAFNKVSSVVDNSGRTIYYYYDPTGHYLDSTRIANSTTSFKYGTYGMTEVYDPRGHKIVKNNYNVQAQVYEQYNADNKKTTFLYDVPALGQTTVIDPLNNSKVVTHDNKFRCIEVKDELNAVNKYGYSSNNTLDTITDAKGFKTITQYDFKGNRIKTINARGYYDSLEYNSFSQPLLVKDKEGNLYKFTYDAANNPIQEILPTGDTIKKQYNSQGLDTIVTDPRGYKIRKNYNSKGDLLQTITPTSVTSFTYDAVGRPVEIIDSYGRKDSLFWNHFDQIIKRKDKLGRVEEFSFDENGNQILYKDKRGLLTYTFSNKFDQIIRIVEPQNHITEYEYDDNQRKTKSRNPNKNTLIYTYDAGGKLINIADSVLGLLGQWTYDVSSNPITYIDAVGKTWVYKVDEINRVTSCTNPLGDSVQNKYNKNNQRIERIDEAGKSFKWEYDPQGRLVMTMDAKNNYVQLYLNKSGMPDSIRDARGNIRNIISYDGSNRVVTVNDGYGNYLNAWDSVDNIKYTTDPNNRTLDYFYNANNEIVDIKNTGNTLRHYDLNENSQFLAANSNTQTITVTRNGLGWVTDYTNTYGNTLQYSYDSIGNITKIIYPGGKQVEYVYNSMNKCVQVKDWTNGLFNITRNKSGAIESIHYPNNFQLEISRDDASQIKSWLNKSSFNSIFQSNLLQRDKTGNILRDSGLHVLTFSLPPQILSGTYGRDDRTSTYGNVSCSTNVSGQRFGQNSPGKLYTFNWSPINELTTVTYNGSGQTMQYDAFNERVVKSTSFNTTRYIVDHSMAEFPLVLQERTGSDIEFVNYLFIPGEGIVLARDSIGVMRYYHHDYKGNTSALSDITGQITDRYEYIELSDSISHIGSSAQPFTWMGMYGVQRDENRLYYLHARYYDGKTGTFISKDPHPVNYLNTQDINRYVYGYNNPLKYFDPTGLVAQNNISYENTNWVRDGFIDALGKIANGNWVGTGYAKEAYDYYEKKYIQSVLNGNPNNWYLVGLSAASLWSPENYQTTLGALTLDYNYTGQGATKLLGKTGYLKIVDMRTLLGRTIKELVGIYDAFDVIKSSYEGIYEKRENFKW